MKLPLFTSWPAKAKPGENYSLLQIPPSAQAFVIAGWFQRHAVPTLIVAEDVKRQEEVMTDLETWGVPTLLFPETEPTIAEATSDPEIAAERLSIAKRLLDRPAAVILTTRAGLLQPLPAPSELKIASVVLKVGQNTSRDRWIAQLEQAEYQREVEVHGRGQFSVRGAVVDLFSWSGTVPVRTEWDGDEIVSLREFDPESQRSLRKVETTEISLLVHGQSHLSQVGSTLLDYLDPRITRLELHETEGKQGQELSAEFFTHDFLHAPRGDWIMQEQRRTLFLDHLSGWLEEKWEVWLFCMNEGEERRLREILQENGVDSEPIHFLHKPLLRGFAWPQGQLVVLSDAEIFGRYQTLRGWRKQERLLARRSRQDAMDFSEWQSGDYVVHLQYGIARYRGLQTLPEQPEGSAEVLVLEFAEQARLYVPLEQAYLVSKYLGAGRKNPDLDILGGARWERARASAQKAIHDYAAQLLKMQAERETLDGHASSPDTSWQKEFEEAFLYDETPDQLKAIIESKRDMESTRPMDRLICGDVGFGKTEVAIRAIFKAVMDGHQAAILVPTTILAQQHYETLCERYADYPIRVELLSRFRTPNEQKATVQALINGTVDVVVGTHRLISKDVRFKKLGLVVIDEEQRFGVLQKEKFKELFRLVDVMTLSATPIPRTLYLALTGARDMSTIETPPPMRQSVETIVSPYDERVIKQAIERELARGGQVFFLHNRILSIEKMAQRLQELVPKSRIEIGHGQMDKEELEEVMHRFIEGKTDILLATSIIENGLDIPNANTIIIDRADRFGLADLYQLRGRVGRFNHKAYAYLLLPRQLTGAGDARKRLGAMRQYSALGSGFRIAMRDLEIRGAGNLLGTAQSGHITAIGFDLYCHLLKRAIKQMKGETLPRLVDSKLQLDFLVMQETESSQDKPGAYLPRRYMNEGRWRIDGYRRVAELNSTGELEELRAEWLDRYGPLPEAAELLLALAELKLLAAERRVHLIEVQGEKLVMRRGQDFLMVGGKFPRLTQSHVKNKLGEIKKWLLSLG